MSRPLTGDHLANERTFLAYIRTALACIGFGFVIARFAVFLREFATLEHFSNAPHSVSMAFGTSMVFIGAAIALFGAYRYECQRRAIVSDHGCELSGGGALAMAGIISAAGAFIAYSLFKL